MRIASTFKCAESAHLDKFDKTSTTVSVVENLPTEILFLLSAPSAPESARTEAIEIAESGETLDGYNDT